MEAPTWGSPHCWQQGRCSGVSWPLRPSHLSHLLIQQLLGQLCGVQGLNTIVVYLAGNRNSHHLHSGLHRLPAGLVGILDVFLKKTIRDPHEVTTKW